MISYKQTDIWYDCQPSTWVEIKSKAIKGYRTTFNNEKTYSLIDNIFADVGRLIFQSFTSTGRLILKDMSSKLHSKPFQRQTKSNLFIYLSYVLIMPCNPITLIAVSVSNSCIAVNLRLKILQKLQTSLPWYWNIWMTYDNHLSNCLLPFLSSNMISASLYGVYTFQIKR